MVLAFVLFSELTKAWLLYLGLIFLVMVMYAPGGIASLIMMNLRVAAHGRLKGLLGHYVLLGITAVVALTGLGALVEMIYHLQLNASMGAELPFMGMSLNVSQAQSWLGAATVTLVGWVLFELARRRFARDWKTVQEAIERQINPEVAQ